MRDQNEWEDKVRLTLPFVFHLQLTNLRNIVCQTTVHVYINDLFVCFLVSLENARRAQKQQWSPKEVEEHPTRSQNIRDFVRNRGITMKKGKFLCSYQWSIISINCCSLLCCLCWNFEGVSCCKDLTIVGFYCVYMKKQAYLFSFTYKPAAWYPDKVIDIWDWDYCYDIVCSIKVDRGRDHPLLLAL